MSGALRNVLIDADACRELAAETGLSITLIADELSMVVTRLNSALAIYALSKQSEPTQPTLADTSKRLKRLHKACREILETLDADFRGPEDNLPPNIPVPGFLTANPAWNVPGVDSNTAFDRGEVRADDARNAMLAEARISLENKSVSGAHDVAIVTVAAVRQLAKLVDEAAKQLSAVQKTRFDPATATLFAELADSFELLHVEAFKTSSMFRTSEADYAAGGKAQDWTLALFKLVASRSKGTIAEAALSGLFEQYSKARDGLAERIYDVGRAKVNREGSKPPKRRGSYRAK